jgi:hypothetical protein
MDPHLSKVLEVFQSHLRIKRNLTRLSYALIFCGLLIYIFYAFNQSRNIKIVSEYEKNIKEYKTEKIMTNPRIKFQYNDTQVYNIRAKKAFHKDENEAILYDVFAEGDIGKITAGELQINQDGDHLVFTKNPILILNKDGQKKSKPKKLVTNEQ